MSLPLRQIPRIAILTTIVSMASASGASAQSCLGVTACLLSPARADAGRPITPNGCSVPPEAGALGQFWGSVFLSACNQHETDWGTFKPDIATWFTQSNHAFLNNMLTICQARTDLPTAQCTQAANIFFLAVSTTSIASIQENTGRPFHRRCAEFPGTRWRFH